MLISTLQEIGKERNKSLFENIVTSCNVATSLASSRVKKKKK